VQALIRFCANPARYLLTRRLGIRLEEGGALLDDVEPMSLEGLERYELGERLAARCLSGREARDLLPAARARGSLPPGAPGECWFQEMCEGVDDFAARLAPHLKGEPLGAVDLDCAIGPFRLTGWLSLGMPAALVHYRYASIKAKDLLRAWIHHLALSAGGGGRYPGRCVIIGQDTGYLLGPVEDAGCFLLGLLELYWQGLMRPLHFFPDTARVYAEALLKGKTGEDALKTACRTWASDRGYAEGDDPYYRLCFGGQDPLDGEFRELADSILRPLLERAEEGP
jgi:exodeoxyribonuclease V gamma subunit